MNSAHECGFQANVDGYFLTDNPLIGAPDEGAWNAGWNEAQRTVRVPWESANYARCSDSQPDETSPR